MVGAQDPHTVGQHSLEQGDRIADAARQFVRARKIVAGGERVGVAGAQDPHTVSQNLLV